MSDKAGLILGEHHDTVDVIHYPSFSREDQCASQASSTRPGAGGVRRYAEAWQANDIDTVLALYDDDFTLHYFGDSPLAGDHAGKDAATRDLFEATRRSGRQLETPTPLYLARDASDHRAQPCGDADD